MKFMQVLWATLPGKFIGNYRVWQVVLIMGLDNSIDHKLNK